MSQFAFSVPTQVLFGCGFTEQTGQEVKKLVALSSPDIEPKALIVVDPGVQAAGILEKILPYFHDLGVNYSIFNRVESNPKDISISFAVKQYHLESANVIVAVGGGSTLDTAKGVALLVCHGGQIISYAGWDLIPGPVAPLVAIPTTAGSGSEVTNWAVITDSNTHTKLAVGSRFLAPAIAIVDPTLTLSLPASLTAATGLDALTHAIEAYTCTLSNPVSDALALRAIQILTQHLPIAVEHGNDLAAREAVQLGSLLAGMAFNNADVAGVHCLSEAMGSLYDAPHGVLNAVLLPYMMAYNQPVCSEQYAIVAQAMQEGSDIKAAISKIASMSSQFHLPVLKDLGIRQSDFPQIARMAAENVSNASNPRPMTEADYLTVLQHAWTGELRL